MYSIDRSQALNGGLFSFGAGLVLSGFNPLPLALLSGLSALVSSIGSDLISKIGKERKLSMPYAFSLISLSTMAIFTISGMVSIFTLEGMLGMAFAGLAYSSWLIVRKWPEYY